MLGDHCKSCRTPLLRARDGNIFCVACDRNVSSEEEEEKQLGYDEKSRNVNDREGNGLGKDNTRGKERKAQKNKETSGTMLEDAITTSLKASTNMDGGAVGKSNGTSSSSSSLSSPSSSLKLATNQSRHLLTGKLKQLNARLVQAAVDNMQELSAVARTISDVVKALSTIQELTAAI